MINPQNERERLIELKGFLNAMAIINSYVDHGKTYYVEKLTKVNNSIQETLLQHLNVRTWTFELSTPAEDWNPFMQKELLHFFTAIISEVYCNVRWDEIRKLGEEGKRDEVEEMFNKLHKRYYTENYVRPFLDLLRGVLADNKFTFYKVAVDWHDKNEGWYECYEQDYVFDFGHEILFLHFGESD